MSVAVLADGANAINGRLSVIGITDRLNAKVLPTAIGHTFLAVQVRMEGNDDVMGFQGKVLFCTPSPGEDPALIADLTLPVEHGERDVRRVNIVLPLFGIPLNSEGDYEIRVQTDAYEDVVVPFEVRLQASGEPSDDN